MKASDKIKLLIENNATSLDKISAMILKLSHGGGQNPLADMVIISMQTGDFPQLLKTAIVYPIF